MHDFLTALDGWAKSKGVGKDAPNPPTRAELDEMMARYPDG
jgi:hypothetical protein